MVRAMTDLAAAIDVPTAFAVSSWIPRTPTNCTRTTGARWRFPGLWASRWPRSLPRWP